MKVKTVVFIGSAKTLTPPWGGPSRVGDCVIAHVLNFLEKRDKKFGDEAVEHEITVFDPVKVFGKDGALEGGGQLSEPHFYFGDGKAPEAVNAMRDKIKEADCYLLITPEYNHSIPPALSSLMGHFGGSNYALKPSAVVTYSIGPWGGARAAIALRPFLSELGCLPVSKMCCFPSATDLFNEDGSPKDPSARMLNQLPKMVSELEWMAIAMKDMRSKHPDPQA